MPLDCDVPIDRLGTGCCKWSRHGPDVLPLPVADMDFAVTPGTGAALLARLQHGPVTPTRLRRSENSRLTAADVRQ